MKRKTGNLIAKKRHGNISLLRWENFDEQGNPFESFSLVKAAKQRNPKNSSEIIIKSFSLNCLSRANLSDIKIVIDQMQHAEAGVDDLLESD